MDPVSLLNERMLPPAGQDELLQPLNQSVPDSQQYEILKNITKTKIIYKLKGTEKP